MTRKSSGAPSGSAVSSAVASCAAYQAATSSICLSESPEATTLIISCSPFARSKRAKLTGEIACRLAADIGRDGDLRHPLESVTGPAHPGDLAARLEILRRGRGRNNRKRHCNQQVPTRAYGDAAIAPQCGAPGSTRGLLSRDALHMLPE